MSRRGNGEGSISKRKDGRWCGRYSVQTPGGTKQKSVYGKTRAEVAKKLARALADRDGGIVIDSENLTLSEFLDRWLEGSVKGSVKPITAETYARTVRVHITPTLGSMQLAKVTPGHLQSLYHSKLAAGQSTTSVRLMHAVVNRALKQALKWRLVVENVAAATDPPKARQDEIRPLDRAQAKHLISTAHDTGERLEALFVLALHTGMRIGELMGLKWQDVDLEGGTVQVRRTLSRVGKEITFTTPKSGKGRAIKLTNAATEALRAHLTRQLQEIEAAGDGFEDHGLVFCRKDGKPLRRENVADTSFRPLLKLAGLPETTRLHDLRHTCATLLLSQGHHPKLVQELLGHSSVAMTLDKYSHVMPGMAEQTAAAMEAALT